ncbi:NAD(P)/FAD-dependent oxidoreductase [Candidatus Pelagibacter sp.]|nr:NAD(P)/FAD-dependent oxidoreductase [Candidatus Pelagibacter sp.]
MIKTDALVIGAGPVGLFCVHQLGIIGLKCEVIDNLDKLGGQCIELYPDKPIYDIPAVPECTGEELTNNLIKQIKPFKEKFILNERVEEIKKEEKNWIIRTNKGTEFESPNIIIAGGVGSFESRKFSTKGAEKFEGKQILYSVKDKKIFNNKTVTIFGGGDSALDWAIEMSNSSKVILVHRRDEFRGAQASIDKINQLKKEGKIEIFTKFQLETVKGNDKLENIIIKHDDKSTKEIKTDYVLGFFGLIMQLGPIAEWGLNLDKKTIPVNTETFETNKEGIFAIGDICSYPGKLKLILSGFHEGALAARGCFKYARPDEKLRFEFTTTSKTAQERLGIKK